MCLIIFSFQPDSSFPLVLLANRDEYHHRPAAPSQFWEEAPFVLAGRDLEAGGTWLGITKSGRWSALTNYREKEKNLFFRSRGELVKNFLLSSEPPRSYLEKVASQASEYRGFNLLAGTLEEIYYFSNRREKIEKLGPGIYGVSNHLLDSPWPKVTRAKSNLEALLRRSNPTLEDLFAILMDKNIPCDDDLPETGVGVEMERILSSAFIQTPVYGTRCSTVFLFQKDGTLLWQEKSFHPEGKERERKEYHFSLGKD